MKRPLFFLAIAFVSGICFGRGLRPDGLTLFLLIFTGLVLLLRSYLSSERRNKENGHRLVEFSTFDPFHRIGLNTSDQIIQRKTVFSLFLLFALLVFLIAAAYSRAAMEGAGRKRERLEAESASVKITGIVSSLTVKEDSIQCILTDAKVITSHGILTPGSLLVYPKIESDSSALAWKSDGTEKESNTESDLKTSDHSDSSDSKSAQKRPASSEFSEEWRPGCHVRLTGQISALEPARNPGNFNARSYYEARGILCAVKNADLISSVKGRNPVDRFRSFLYVLRSRMTETYTRALPGEEGGLLASMTLGSREELSEEARGLFQKAGLIHLMAVSGTHIQVVASRLYKKLKKKGVGLFLSGLLAGLAALFYGALCGNSLSTDRAVGMFLLLVLGDILGRAYDTLTGLGLLAVLLLLRQPAAIEDTGFIFSFSAVLVMVLFQNPLARAYQSFCKNRYERKYRRKVGERFLLSLPEQAALRFLSALGFQLATLPLMAYLFYEIPVYVFLLNLLVLPLFPLLLILGLAGGLILSLLPLDFLLWPCHLILYLYEWTADLSQRMPGGRLIVGKPALALISLYYLILMALTHSIQRKIDPPRVLALLALSFLLIARLPEPCHVDMLDVGQGDGILIHDRKGGNLMVDGGSSDVNKVGTYRILPYLKEEGIRSLDSWVISHTDNDHISGMKEVIESGYPLGQIIIAKGMPRDESWEEIAELAEAHEIPVREVSPGDCLVMGDSRLTFLYPEGESVDECGGDSSKKAAGEASKKTSGGSSKKLSGDSSKESSEDADKNALCLSFWLETGDACGIFTGDLPMESENEIMETEFFSDLIRDRNLTFIKIGHHGSATSSAEDWLDALNPETALISAGQNNRYGHPSKETIERLDDRNIPWHLTSQEGMIRVELGRKIKVSSYLTTCSRSS